MFLFMKMLVFPGAKPAIGIERAEKPKPLTEKISETAKKQQTILGSGLSLLEY